MLWPDADIAAGRHNFSTNLTILRHLLEPAGVPPGAVIVADRHTVRLNAGMIECDAHLFERLAVELARSDLSEQEVRSLSMQGANLYAGALLPGFYEDWIGPEAIRFESLFQQLANRAVPVLARSGFHEEALAMAHRAVQTDALNEDALLLLLKSMVASGQYSMAMREYRKFERRCKDSFGGGPSTKLVAYAQRLQGRINSQDDVEHVIELSPAVEPIPTPTSSPAERVDSEARLRGDGFLLLTTTRFFDRHSEISRLHEMVRADRTRLVTITGPGGTGKTRLALEATAQLVERQEDAHAVFVPLADVRHSDRIFDVILRRLGVVPLTDVPTLDQIGTWVATTPNLLLVLDNFEQLVDEGAALVQLFLATIPTVKCLVTSRQRLLIEGEEEFNLSPLPKAGGGAPPKALLERPSVALLVDRAQAARPDFQLTERNSVAVAELCDHLEGIPQAIELAAARLQLLSVDKILEQVKANRLDFLATRKRDVAPRHKTLRSTLDWSYELLPSNGQKFLAQLSVFRGGFTLESAASISNTNEASVLELLGLLRDNSLIQVLDQPDGLRFNMLETVREYAADHLRRDEGDGNTRKLFAHYFVNLAEEAKRNCLGPEESYWFNRLEAEHDNIRATLAWCLGGSDRGQEALQLISSLGLFWSRRSYVKEGLEHCRAALAHPGAQNPDPLRGSALNSAGILAKNHGNFAEARGWYEESLPIQIGEGETRGAAIVLNNLAVLAIEQGDFQAAQAFSEQALPMFETIGIEVGVAAIHGNLGCICLEAGDFNAARGHFAQHLEINKRIGNRAGEVVGIEYHGETAFWESNLDEAARQFELALAMNLELGDQAAQATCLTWLSDIAKKMGNVTDSRKRLFEAIALNDNAGSPSVVERILRISASLLQVEKRHEDCIRLIACLSSMFARRGQRASSLERLALEATLAEARASIETERYEKLWDEGTNLSPGQGIAVAVELLVE